MSASTSQAMTIGLQSLSTLVGLMAAGKLASVNATIQAGLTSGNAEIQGRVDTLQKAFDSFETSNQLVGEALDTTRHVLDALGLQVPSEAQVVSHVKAAIADAIGAVQAQG